MNRFSLFILAITFSGCLRPATETEQGQRAVEFQLDRITKLLRKSLETIR